MGINAKNGIKIVGENAYIHPLSLEEIEFVLGVLANADHKGFDAMKVAQVAQKLQEDRKSVV